MPNNNAIGLRYRYLLFDLDRTLWDFDENAKRAIFYLLDRYDPHGNSLYDGDKEEFFRKYEEINYTLWSEYEAGKITREELRAARFYKTFLLYGYDNQEMSTRIDIEYLQRMSQETALMPGALEVLKRSKEAGCKIALISNGFKEVQTNKVRTSGIGEYIDLLMTSEEAGVHKPSPAIFRITLSQLYDGPLSDIRRQTLMIGDDFTNDIEGAQIFGIDQFFYNYRNIPCNGGPTYMSDNLLDILGIILS